MFLLGESQGWGSLVGHRVGHDWSDLAAAGATIREEACEEQELVVIEGGGISGGEGLSKASLVIS